MMFFEGNDWQNMDRQTPAPYLASALDLTVPVGNPEDVLLRHERSHGVIQGWWKDAEQSSSTMLARRSWLRNFVALQQTSLVLGLHYPKASREKPEFAKMLDIAQGVVKGWGGDFMVVYVPQVDRFVGLLPSSAAFDDLRNLVVDAAGETGVPLIDLTPAFKAHPAPRNLYASDSHFSPDGARLAAEIILNHLQ
ncbi:MAG: hypothetical protein AAF225_14130 [Pseudomonadota bacterium]